MNLPAEISLLAVFTGLVGLLLMFPLPGVDVDTEIEVQGESFDIELVSTPTLDSGNHWGMHDIISHNMRIATGSKGLVPFLSTCSHELYHLEYDLEDEDREDPLTTEEEHELMPFTWYPWNWKIECFQIVPARFSWL